MANNIDTPTSKQGKTAKPGKIRISSSGCSPPLSPSKSPPSSPGKSPTGSVKKLMWMMKQVRFIFSVGVYVLFCLKNNLKNYLNALIVKHLQLNKYL